MHASLARRASNTILDFHRLDYPQMDPSEWKKLLPIKQADGEVKVRDLPLDYFLKPPFALHMKRITELMPVSRAEGLEKGDIQMNEKDIHGSQSSTPNKGGSFQFRILHSVQ